VLKTGITPFPQGESPDGAVKFQANPRYTYRRFALYILLVCVNRTGGPVTLLLMDAEALKKKFGRRVRSLRKLRDLTQEQLAEAGGISPEYVGKIERGQASPSFDSITRLASAIDKLVGLIGQLESGRVKMLADIARSLSKDVEEQINPDSDLVTQDFAEAFAARILIHHALMASEMKKRRFEYALQQTARAVGYDAELTRSRTNPGQDIRIDGTAFSLKTEAASNIRPDKITISKFQEARWIRNCHTPAEFAEGTRRNVGRHLNQYERILLLRVFELEKDSFSGESVRYDLVEIPVPLLRKALELPDEEFDEETKAGSSGADIREAGRRLFRLTLDGSVEKVTIRSLLVDACIEHGSWTAPLSV